MTRANTTEETAATRAAEAAETTLESFVAQLHDEGVEAGRKEAEEVIRTAEAEAETILRQARAEADGYAKEAEATAAAAAERGRAELELAVRDAILQLQATLNAVLGALITRAVEPELSEPEALKPLLRDVVQAYARADAEARPTEFRVPVRAARALESWWSQELAGALDGAALTGSLAETGFEYDVGGGTVEVSVESVVEKLKELVRPGLREVVEKVTKTAAAETVSAGASPSGLTGSTDRAS